MGLCVLTLFIGCGYKPSAQYARDILGQKIYPQISITRLDPKNSVIVKDAISEAIITRFHGKLSAQEDADSMLHVSFGSVSFKPIVYDQNGYIIAYKATVNLSISYSDKNKKTGTLSTSGEFDFPITANSVISDNLRFEAIKSASLDAINEFISAITIKGMQNGKHNQ